MAKQYSELNRKLSDFINAQKLFFVATAAGDSRINLSPKGLDSLRILSNQRLIWLNLTGSGNETSAHVQADPRMTLMFCAFEGAPMILRVYGSARVIHKNDSEWPALFAHFKPLPGARQLFDVAIEMVQTSCGMAVPFYDYAGDRQELVDWAAQRGDDGLQRYWLEKNQTSIDNLPTYIESKNC
ncbi:MAG: pyridoxamine 5'-phosphate oxidase [Methylobacter sp.]|nr:MAG: pyridoxamine 5'-phosphate oxidase [Methylobacter sp.]